MKKTILLVVAMVLCAMLPVIAAFCHNCGKELPGEANFCPACGKAVTGAFQTAQPAAGSTVPAVQSLPSVNPVTVQSSQMIVEAAAIADYDHINQMEMQLTSSSYGVASRQVRELRVQNEMRMSRLESGYRYFNAYQRKLHDLHLKKQKAVEDYLEAWKGTEYGPDRARSMAEKDRALFVLGAVNEMIDTLLSGGGTLNSISRVEEMERRLQKTSANFVVTAPYILVDNQRLNRGEPIWVIDVVSAEARVLHMGKGRSSQPICGWVSIYDLEKRSNWRSDPIFFYSSPSNTTVIVEKHSSPPVKVIITNKKRYPYRHDRHRHQPRRHDPHRRGPFDRPPYDHRRYDYVVISPKFW